MAQAAKILEPCVTDSFAFEKGGKGISSKLRVLPGARNKFRNPKLVLSDVEVSAIHNPNQKKSARSRNRTGAISAMAGRILKIFREFLLSS